jgi:hypothetical protein
MKATGNPIANFDPRHSFTGRCDLSGAVGQWNDADLRWTATAGFEDHQIAVVERARADPHEELLQPEPRILARPLHDAVNAAEVVDAIGLHPFPLRWPRNATSLMPDNRRTRFRSSGDDSPEHCSIRKDPFNRRATGSMDGEKSPRGQQLRRARSVWTLPPAPITGQQKNPDCGGCLL